MEKGLGVPGVPGKTGRGSAGAFPCAVPGRCHPHPQVWDTPGGLLQPPCHPRAPNTSLPPPEARKPDPSEQPPGVSPASTPPPTLAGVWGPPRPLGDVQRAASLITLSQPLQQVQSMLRAMGGRDTEVGKPLSPMHPSLGCTLGAAEPREPVQRVNPPARQVETWEGRAGWGSSPGWREQVAGCSLVDPGVRVLGTPHFTSPGGAVPQPGLRTGHETLGGGFGGLQDAAGEPGAAGGPATVQHLPPAAGGSGGRGRR